MIANGKRWALVVSVAFNVATVAGLVYVGSAANRPLTLLAEQRDGRTLFGVALASLDAVTFDRYAARLGISRHTLARVVGGLTCYADTHALVRQRIDALDLEDARHRWRP